MTESLKRKLHDDILRRWFAVRTPDSEHYGKRDYDTSHIASLDIGYADWLNSASEHDAGDELRSYGPHFPLVTAVRERSRSRTNRVGKTRLWLLNGDTWGGASGFGVATSSQQNDCRGIAESSGIATIILPYSALDGARIDRASIRPLVVDRDSWETVEFVSREFPTDARWESTHEIIPGTGYYWHADESRHGADRYATMADIPAEIRAYFDADGRRLPEYVERIEHGTAFGRRYRKYGNHPARDYATGDIEPPIDNGWSRRDYYYVPPVYRYTGRKLTGTHGDYAQDETGLYRQNRRVHTLGQSVFRAAYRGDNGKRYWANFLSGIDTTPTGSGYFLVQLPRNADVSSVQSAIESLKPESVRAAESLGIECKRQGDIFAIPTEFTLRQLRAMGAEIRQSRLAGEARRAAIRQEWEDRFTTALMELGMPTNGWQYRQSPENVQWRNFQRMQNHYSTMARRALAEHDSVARVHTQRELYGTRHYGTDIAILPNGVTLARGTIRHSGGDHSMLRLGNVWHIAARNTVPLAR